MLSENYINPSAGLFWYWMQSTHRAQYCADSLPLDVEATVVILYKFFYQYTERVTNLKQFSEFCELAEVEFERLLSHGSTRFLRLMPAVERILNRFLPLKLYLKQMKTARNCWQTLWIRYTFCLSMETCQCFRKTFSK